MKKGDIVLLPQTYFNMDPATTENSDEVNFTRRPRNITFGAGPHTCAGALLARKELGIFLEEWLTRIPDFSVDPAKPLNMFASLQNTVATLWLQWETTH